MTQLVRYQPWWLAGLERQVDELTGALAVPYQFPAVPAGTFRWAPACEVFSRNGDLVAELDLPGIDPDKDVQVTVQDGTLCVRGERHRPEAVVTDGYSRGTSRYGVFERGFTLPEGTTGEGITASYRDGVLAVVVPKAAQRAPARQVPVSSGASHNGHPAAHQGEG